LPSLLRPTTSRALHLRITPRPSTLGETREILRLVSQFGEIEYFKNLKYDVLTHPQAMLVIFREESAARECFKKSPIRFRMGRAVTPAPAPAPASAPMTQRGGDGAEGEGKEGEGKDGTAMAEDGWRMFQITNRMARVHFRDKINAMECHGSFAVDTKTAAQQDLKDRVPAVGLSDLNFRKAEKPWGVARRQRERDAAFNGSGRRRSLMEVYEEAWG
ncbi:hypothetical protein BAUCODRAFT_58250, partial [Baudoinia panamericana UAMH 10762]